MIDFELTDEQRLIRETAREFTDKEIVPVARDNDRNERFDTELVKKPKDLLEYVVVHEMLHLIEPTHSDRFIALLNKHYPAWREARAELNELPLAAAVWKE